MRQTNAICVGLLAFTLVIGLTASAQAESFTDGTFNNADWTAQFGAVSPTTMNESFTATQVSSGGNPGHYRETTHTWDGPGNMNVIHLRTGAVYEPSVSGRFDNVKRAHPDRVKGTHPLG